jgi:amino acid adenylation domain-containing protein
VDGIRRLAARNDSTHFTVLLAAYAALLHRHSGQDDLVVGVPAAPQVLAGLKNLVGHCVNLLPIRSRVAEGQDFAGLLQDTRRTTLDAFEHWHHPFARLLNQLNLPRDPNRVPLANVTFNVGRQRGTLEFAGLQVEAASNPKRFVNFDLNFNITETDDGFVLDCYYSTELFDAATVECMADRYEELIQSAAAAPSTPVHRLRILPAAERQRLLVEWNHTAAHPAPARCLHDLFAEQVTRTPKALAVADDQTQLTYRELREASSALAHRLRARGVHAGDRVAVCLEPSVALPIALLAVLKTGAAYVPLDAGSPVARLNFMVADAGVRVVVTQEKLASLFGDPDQILCLDAPADVNSQQSNPPIEVCAAGQDAYVIYTSGSTGMPKGVPISHASVANLIAWHRRTYAVTPADRATQIASPAFDACVWELWPYLTTGASVHFPPAESRLSPARLIAWLAATRITLCFLPTPLAEAVMDESWPPNLPLRAILTGGDRLRRWPGDRLPCLLANHYGPTECTVLATAAAVPAEADGSVVPSIGHPIDNHRVYLLDRHLELVPPGVPGELCIAGTGVARGYLNQPELTREKFVPDPFAKNPGDLLYRTGDLARHRADGSIEFLGRLDHQVKIRGYRIELGEIEAALQRLTTVRECVVLAREDAPGEKRLVAYVVAAGDAPAATDLRAALARDLPAHMLPAAFVFLDRLPLTTTGKIDRRALPAPDTTAPAEPAAETTPRTITEEVLAGIWCDVLRLPSVGLRDNFFELGGHSLLVTQVLARVQQAFHLELPLRHAFEAPTVAELAAVIENALVEDIRASTEPETFHADLAR